MGLYTRHGSQGGKFKRGDFGDLGLRAFATAREREKRAAQEQLQQQNRYSEQHLRQLEGSGAKEIAHNRMLQGLEEDVGGLALQNTKLRGKREVEEILGRAKEAEKSSEFWKNFSTTYSKQYAKAAGELHDFATEIQHQNQMDAWRKNPEAQKAFNNFGHLNELTNKNLLIDSYKGLRDKGIPSEDARSMVIAQYSDLGLRMNHKTKMALANMVLKKWSAQEALIKEEAKKAEIPWKAENISELYKLRAYELLKEYGISPTSIAGRHLLNGIYDKSFDKSEEANKADIASSHLDLFNRQKTQAKNLIKGIKYSKGEDGRIVASGDSVGNFVSAWNQMVIHYATMYKTDSSGNVIEPKYGAKPNISLAHQVLGEEFIKAGYFNSWDQIENHLINIPIPDEKDPYKVVEVGEETTISFKEGGAWGKKQPVHRDVFLKTYKEYKADQATKSKAALEAEDIQAMLDLNERYNNLDPSDPNYFNAKDPEHIQKALITYDGKDKTTKMLRDFQIFNQFDKDSNVVNRNLTALWKDADLPNLTEYIQHLDGDEKEKWISIKNQLALLDRIGLNKSGITAQVTKYLHMIVNDESVKKDLSLYADTRGDIKQEILNQLSIIESDPTLSKLGDQAKWVEIDKRIKDQMELDGQGRKDLDGNTYRGYGIFRRRGEKLQTKFLAWDHDEGTGASLDQIKDKLKEKADWNTMFLQISTKGGVIQVGDTSLPVIPLDEADALIRAVDGGYPIPFNATIKWLAEEQPARLDGKPLLTEREITNLILKGLGVKKEVPQGSREFADYIINKPAPSTDEEELPNRNPLPKLDRVSGNPGERKPKTWAEPQLKREDEISFNGIERYSTANRVACSVYAQCVRSGLVAAGHNAQRDKWTEDRQLRQQFLTT